VAVFSAVAVGVAATIGVAVAVSVGAAEWALRSGVRTADGEAETVLVGPLGDWLGLARLHAANDTTIRIAAAALHRCRRSPAGRDPCSTSIPFYRAALLIRDATPS
jgi:hypothetical protein